MLPHSASAPAFWRTVRKRRHATRPGHAGAGAKPLRCRFHPQQATLGQTLGEQTESPTKPSIRPAYDAHGTRGTLIDQGNFVLLRKGIFAIDRMARREA